MSWGTSYLHNWREDGASRDGGFDMMVMKVVKVVVMMVMMIRSRTSVGLVWQRDFCVM